MNYLKGKIWTSFLSNALSSYSKKIHWVQGPNSDYHIVFNFGTKFLQLKYCPSVEPNEYLGDLILTNDIILCHMTW